jgi:DNA modification methylase
MNLLGLDRIYHGDSLDILRTWPDAFVQTVVTSPPYWGLRDYSVLGQIGLEKTPEAYVSRLVEVFREVRRVLKDDGTLWLNLGDTFANNGTGGNGSTGGRDKSTLNSKMPPIGTTPVKKSIPYGLKQKDLVGIPWMVAFALRTDGWYLRSDIIWHKPNPMPESVTDRPTKSHEYIFLMSKRKKYYYDAKAIKEPAIYFDDDRKGRALEAHKYMPTGTHNGIRPVYKDARSYDGKHSDKQRGHVRRHAGFNDRWDAMDKIDQCGSMRNKRDVWTVATSPYLEAHFATFPPSLIKPCILAGSRQNDIVMDPFMGAGTTALVAVGYSRKFLGVELNPKYIEMADRRISSELAQIKFL